MSKKIIGLIAIVCLIIISAYMFSSSQTIEADVINISEENFTALYEEVEFDLDITKEDNSFLINDQVVPEPIIIKPNTTLVVNVTNNTNAGTSVHFHGINGLTKMDGVSGITQDQIKPGESFTYKFNIDDAGTYMYHAHMDSVNQVNNENLFGGLVVNEQQYDNQFMLMFNTDVNSINNHHNANLSYDQVEVNGVTDVTYNIESDENIILNIVNMSSAPINIDFGQNIKYRITSIDANETTGVWSSSNKIILPTANRITVEIENPKRSFNIQTAISGVDNALVNFKYKDQLVDDSFVDYSMEKSDYGMMSSDEYSRLGDATSVYNLVETIDGEEIAQLPVSKSFDMELSMGSGMWQINDKDFPNTDSVDVTEGDVVAITLQNTSHMSETHPFHLHGHKFIVSKYNGQEVEKPLLLDTIDVKPGDTIEIKLLADNPGIWAFHCHNLIHAKLGMMTTMEYEGYMTPFEGASE